MHCKNIWVTLTIISVTSVACVWGMHHEVQGSLLKTLKSKHSFFNYQSSLQKTNQLPFLEKAWLHSYGRNTSNVHVAKIGLLKFKIMKRLLDGIQETHFRCIPGTSDNDTTLVQLR